MDGTHVEVRKNAKSTTWYNAFAIDAHDRSVLVRFEDDVWPQREVATNLVRRRPRATDVFEAKTDDVVEVVLQASDSNPSGWVLGRIQNAKHSFYFVTFVGVKSCQEVIVEGAALRPCSGEQPLDETEYVKRNIPIGDAGLRDWIQTPDAQGCLSHVQKTTGVFIVKYEDAPVLEGQNQDLPPDVSAKVVLVGSKREVDAAERLLTLIHFKNQVDMQRYHALRDELLERLAEARRRNDALQREVFTVEKQLVGRVIGKGGENINKVRSRHGVEVDVRDGDQGRQEGFVTVVVTGGIAENVQKARDELEYVTDRIELQSEHVGWILGKGYQNILEIAKKTELTYARFDDKARRLELSGLKHQVDSARLLVEAHTGYLPKYQTMGAEYSDMQAKFEELDVNVGSTRRAIERQSESGSKK